MLLKMFTCYVAVLSNGISNKIDDVPVLKYLFLLRKAPKICALEV